MSQALVRGRILFLTLKMVFFEKCNAEIVKDLFLI